MKKEVMETKIQILEHALAASAGTYYNINLTKDLVPGTMYQVIENKEYSVNEQIGLPENARFTDIVDYWGKNLPEEEKTAYFDFLKISNLIEQYQKGESHVFHKYWTKTALFEPMLAEHHIVMYKDEETGDILGITYVLDLTRQYREEQYKTELEKGHKELENALLAAQHANQAKTIFLNNMSHDIRTPMNAIIGFTSLAASHVEDSGKVKEYLKKIATSSEHLLSLINDVLDMSRIESGKVKIEEHPLHLPDLIHDIKTIIQTNVASKQLDFFIDTVEVKNEDIITDKLRLTQVLLNILSNGIKFNRIGGTLGMKIKQVPGAPAGYANYHFIIRDTGFGMKEEFVSHIFEAFTREETSTVSGIQGTGLGMAITKNIVDMMGGSIQVKSEEQKGTEFDVSLMFRLCGEAVAYEKLEHLQGLNVLVADDDVDTCLNISSMLKEIGMRAEWTVSGKEAVIRTKHALDLGDEFYAYIIDWLMPDMNGIEIVRRIRKVIGDSKPIIILTAYDWSEVEEEAREAGVTAFCEKPLFMSELRDLLSQPQEEKTKAPEKKLFSQYAGKKILLVEDNELNLEIATAMLEEAGFLIDTAQDGLTAVEKMEQAKKKNYDLILMDIQMPLMDGYEATKRIRGISNAEVAAVPIVAMTANAFEEDREKAYEAGMNGYISKPIKIQELVETIADVLKVQ